MKLSETNGSWINLSRFLRHDILRAVKRGPTQEEAQYEAAKRRAGGDKQVRAVQAAHDRVEEIRGGVTGGAQ